MPVTRYRQLQSPVGVDVLNQDTGGAQAAQQLADSFTQFSWQALDVVAGIRSEQGVREGEIAGAAGAPETRTGMRANTPYGRAYNSASEAAYSSKIQTDIDSTVDELEQTNEADPEGYATAVKGYSDELIKTAPPEYRVRVRQALVARVAAGTTRIRNQVIAEQKDKDTAAVLAGQTARANLALAAAEYLSPEEGDAALAASVADNKTQLDALVADHAISAVQAGKLQEDFAASLDKGLFAMRTSHVVEGLMNEARGDVLRGDRLLAGVLADEAIPADERAEIRKAYDAQRTALAEDRGRVMVPESVALAKRLAADESGAGVENESWRLYRRGGISAAEHEGNLRKSVENSRRKFEDGLDVAAVLDILKHGRGLDPADAKQRKALNTMVDQTVVASGMQPGDPRWTAFMIDTTKNTNILPAAAESYARVNMLSGDPLQAAQGAAFFDRVQNENPIAWDYNSDPKLASFGEQMSQNLAAGIAPERAYELAHRNVYELKEEQKELLQAQYGARKDVLADNGDALMSALNDDPNFDPTVFASSPDASIALSAEYNHLVGQYYVSTNGDIETARNLAGKAVRSRYGVTEVNGTRELMKYAPERMYPGLSAAVIRDDMMKSVAAVPNAPNVVHPSKLRLVPEGRGHTERSRGLKWNILVLDEDGDHDVIRGPNNKPLVYVLPLGENFASAKARIAAEQLVEAAREDEAARKRDPLYRDLQREQLDNAGR